MRRPMKIATWNVNSIRARMPRVAEWLAERRQNPEVAARPRCRLRDHVN
jgi:exonuclease III